MAWETRGAKGVKYYYRSRRDVNGRVVKEYLGRGEKARAAAKADRERRAQEESVDQSIHEVMGMLTAVDRRTALLGTAAQLLLEATLLGAGFHRHNYKRWRKRHGHGRKRPGAAAGDSG
jgi:hypothetical protein